MPESMLPITEQNDVLYSESKSEHNMRPRACICYNCKYTVMTDLMGPKCKGCNSYVITLHVPKSLNELAR